MRAWSTTRQFGGVFRSVDGGAHWEQLGAGLDGRDVFALAETKDGAIVAGTSHGIFVLDPPASEATSNCQARRSLAPAADRPAHRAQLIWKPRNTIANTMVKTSTETHRGTKVNIEKQVKAPVDRV